jgi:DNA-binding Lrp family transcriptional regulator
MTYNGEPLAYCTIPMYIMQNMAEDKNLTSSAIVVYLRLLAYASCVNTGKFVITIAWVAKNTGLSRKTVERSLNMLKELGYITHEGLNFGEPKSKQTRETAKGYADYRHKAVATTNTPSVTVNHLDPVLEVVSQPAVKESLTAEPVVNSDTLQQDQSIDLNALLRSLGSTKRVGQKVVTAVESAEKVRQNDPKPVDKMTHSIGQNVSQIGQNDALHINNPNKQSKIKHSSTPSVTVGLLPSTSPRGFVEPSKPKSLATMLQGFATGKPKPALHGKQTAYIETALQRMKVTSPSERARLQSEIAYAATQGAFSDTYSHTPLKAIRACLNLVESGRWKPNAGMYA